MAHLIRVYIIFLICQYDFLSFVTGFLSQSQRRISSSSSSSSYLYHSIKSRLFTEKRSNNINDSEEGSTINLEYAESKLNITGVTLKMAFDSTFAVADASEHKSERFTCPESLDMVHRLRRWSDAVLVGRGTVQRDDCTLTVRRVALLPNRDNQPTRVVIDPMLKILQGDYAMFRDGHRVLIYHHLIDSDDTINDQKKNKALQHNVELVRIPQDESLSSSIMSVRPILEDLYSKKIHHVMVEGGPATAIQFLKEKLVDRAIFVKAPVTFIEPVPSGMSNDMMNEAGLKLIKTEQCGDDLIEYWSKDGTAWPSIEDNVMEKMWPY